jgi:beta-phosphoglucomutase-like phosphatase (HAD superfamily)
VIRAVVFDFDGVIANSEPLHLQAFQGVLAEEGLALSEIQYYTRYLGFDDAGVFRAVGADRGRPFGQPSISSLVSRKAARLEVLERERALLFPGAADAVRRLARSYPLAIASGALGAEIRRVLDREGLTGSFQTIVAAEDTPASKPAPDPYRLAVSRLATIAGAPLEPRQCVAVEDSRWGLESARTAGLHTVAITHSYPASELTGADAVVEHLSALTVTLLQQLDSSA